MHAITEVNYTQGNREVGADFVLTKYDDLLMSEDYVGVIVKSVSIKQNHEDVRRQIRECEQPRPIEGGKKAIHLTEIWIITSKDITRNAKDSIHHEYKNTRIKFFDCEKLTQLIDRYYPAYWDFANIKINKYLQKQIDFINQLDQQHALVPAGVGKLDIPQHIIKIPKDAKRKFRSKQPKPTTLHEEIIKNRFVFVEGGMGSGKSELVRSAAKKLCDQQYTEDFKKVPYFTTYRELQNLDTPLISVINEIEQELNDDTKEIVIFIDGLDETQDDASQKVNFICSLAKELSEKLNTKLVVTSRTIHQEKLQEQIGKYFDHFEVSELSHSAIISFVERLCNNVKVSSKFRSDLENSPLMRALPRTPLSAILLGRLLSENVKELPSTLPELYSKYTELVLGRWDLQKGNGSEKEYETINRIVGSVAGHMLEHDLENLSLSEVTAIFKDYLSQRRTGQDPEALINSFLRKTEIIGYDEEKRTIFFKHKTFKEFFYATLKFQQTGLGAPIHEPFNIFWHGVEYFYLGIVRDAPERIEQISKIMPKDEMEELVKLSSFSDLLLAAYQTPYKVIEAAVSHAMLDTARLFLNSCTNQTGWLNHIPELQLLCLFTYHMRKAYSYDFFLPALHEAKIQTELDTNLSDATRNATLFFIDSVLAELNDKNAFISLVENHENSLHWAIKLGIEFTSKDSDFVNSATKKIAKKTAKAMRGNINLHKYILELQDTPINKRKDLSTNTSTKLEPINGA
ncbi:NACHT domain-containing protein [Pseudomonas peradeniyensis]|uniref:NACHT domain-containing protein n=1 Tax=Pseudomonas peradeniyensis TaxID=2745488 RepID=A0ABT2V648_9PSED|nr:NACHT domain-containing protein [Pseudomonas peradeniyensis]MCU7237174.1 NACHT domain-containing protein [Pseudomonas peradeniyensis]